MICALAVATGVSPVDLAACDYVDLVTMADILNKAGEHG